MMKDFLQTMDDSNVDREYNLDYIRQGSTCMAKAFKHLYDMHNSFEQPVILDISGDGINNCHDGDIIHQYNRLNKLDWWINGIVFDSIINHNITVKDYYKDITNGFVLAINHIDEFSKALRRKIGLEVAELGK